MPTLHASALARDAGWAEMPQAFDRKLPDAGRVWRWVFPATRQEVHLVNVDPTTLRPCGHAGLFEPPLACTVRIVDARGKAYLHEIGGWWYPEKVPPVPKQQWWRS